MRVAVTYENGEIYGHFGHTEQFKIYDIEDGKITKSEVVDTNGSGHGALAGFLSDADADILICGAITPRCVSVFALTNGSKKRSTLTPASEFCTRSRGKRCAHSSYLRITISPESRV